MIYCTSSFIAIEDQICDTTPLRQNSDRQHKNLAKFRQGTWVPPPAPLTELHKYVNDVEDITLLCLIACLRKPCREHLYVAVDNHTLNAKILNLNFTHRV